MTDRPTARMVIAATGISLLAAGGADANRLLNEQWLNRATAAQVSAEIASGADPSAVSPERLYTPLMLASRYGNLEAMEVLLGAGVDPDQSARVPGPGPMHFAANGLTVELLFDWGAKIDLRDQVDFTPLHYAAWNSRLDAMHALIRRGADVHAQSKAGNTPLHRAAQRGQPAAAQILTGAGADVDAPNSEDVTPLFVAAKHNSPQMVEVLLDTGADPTIQTVTGWFPAETAFTENPKIGDQPVIDRLFGPLGEIPALPGEVSDAPCDGWRVRPGDTGHIIAKEGLGDRNRYREIGRLNGLSGRNMHTVGMCLKLPGRRAGTRSQSQPVQTCNGYVVKGSDRKSGDVAEAALGDRSRWPEIATLNGITAENPHRARPVPRTAGPVTDGQERRGHDQFASAEVAGRLAEDRGQGPIRFPDGMEPAFENVVAGPDLPFA